MRDTELALLSTWRFTKVKSREKVPYPASWQTNHLSLSEIPYSDNVGVVLGEASNGLMALDFDGPTSWDWFTDNIGCNLPDTVSWTSGKDARVQMAYTIPADYWPYIRTHKVTTKPGDKASGLKPEQMEFRWNGLQSVLPPSIHPEYLNGYTYEWLSSPSATAVAQLPDTILTWLLSQGLPKPVVAAPITKTISTITDYEFNRLEESLETLHGFYPTLEYDDWFRVMCATAHEIGDQAASMLMQKYWPERVAGEYMAHLRGRRAGVITPGTIIDMIRRHNANYRKPFRKSINNKMKF